MDAVRSKEEATGVRPRRGESLRRRVVGLMALLVAGAGAYAAWTQFRTPTMSPEGRLMAWGQGGRRDVTAKDLDDLIAPPGIEIARGADRVEFIKVNAPGYGEPWTVAKTLDGTAEQLARARDLLLTADVYSYDRRGGHKKCGGFQPRDVVRFWRGDESVTFLICFSCKDVAVVTQDAAGRGRPYVIADSRNGDERLRALMEGVFPGTVGAGH